METGKDDNKNKNKYIESEHRDIDKGRYTERRQRKGQKRDSDIERCKERNKEGRYKNEVKYRDIE